MSEHIEKLIIKALQGNILPEEHHELERWLADDHANKKLFDEFAVVWNQTAEGSRAGDSDHEGQWERLAQKLESAPEEQTSRTMMWALRAAAAVLFVLLCTYFYNTKIASDKRITFTTDVDTLSLKLPDGSQVTLNHHTTLSYSSGFDDDRSITLKGEAFFEVVNDKDHPFVVLTERATVKVLGTSFNVDAQPFETRLAVVTGVVEFSTPDVTNPSQFSAGESGIASVYGILTSDDPNALAWKNRTLVFKDTPLQAAASAIEKYFNKDVQVADNLSACMITAEFKNPTLDEVIAVLRDALELDVKIEGGQYILNGEGCNASQ